MKIFKKTFDFYVTDAEIDNYIHSILQSPQVDLEDEIDIALDRDDYNCNVILKVFDRVLN
tara:strand:+ start:203 stop:382 length:180 start_codon:yes stop_codon:yes gene_type:complete